MMQEFNALLELLAMLATDPRTVVLFALLITAGVIDYRTHRIPNWLSVGGITFALLYTATTAVAPGKALLIALGGIGIGFVTMLPAYLMRVMGAGDVKLMAMVGAFLGVYNTFTAVLFVFIAGGIGAIGFALARKSLRPMLSNVRNVAHGMAVSATFGVLPGASSTPIHSVGKLPYGVCIGIGTIVYVVARQLGYA